MKNFKVYSDEGLVKLLKQQELGAFEEIYMRYWKKLYSAAYKRVQSREVSEELVQDIFTALWMNRQTLAVENLSAYLYSAIKYKVINHLEKEMSRRLYTQAQLRSLALLDNTTEETV
jgi:RNA polymerase sigma-70 factor (ECF subfamily)